jgi:sugar O-acyltransferase (sialic acid O-acetyltransferase NeuD family)
MNQSEIILVGGGGHCRACIEVIEQQGMYRIAGVLDLPEQRGAEVLGYPVIGCDEDIPGLIAAGRRLFIITLGQIMSARQRQALFDLVKENGGELPTIVSPLAHVSRHATVDEGTIVMHGALVNAGARIGRNCIVNSKALVEHDARVGDHCHISTACVLNGGAKVGECSFVGSNAVTLQNVEIGRQSVVGAGVLVRQSLPDNSLFVGRRAGFERNEG